MSLVLSEFQLPLLNMRIEGWKYIWTSGNQASKYYGPYELKIKFYYVPWDTQLSFFKSIGELENKLSVIYL